MQTLRVNASRPYEVSVGSGLLELIKARSAQALVVCQPGSKSHAEKVAQILENQRVHVHRFQLPDGEEAKTLQWIGKTYQFAVDTKLERSATVYAVGGGCVGDAAGFFAATYFRGIKLVQVPTTLMAMVDSSIGGKTGINIGNTKNMAGAFWQPEEVVCDVSTLESLPAEHMQNGLAEIIKHGLILDADYFEFVKKNLERILSKNESDLEKTVAQSVRLKAALVERDERENGEQMKLNYGHTLGHGIEVSSGMLHGCAISVGMAAEGLLSKKLGFLSEDALEQQNSLLTKAGLPLSSQAKLEDTWEKMKNDKKRAEGRFRVVVLDRIGACHVETVEEKDVKEALKGVLA